MSLLVRKINLAKWKQVDLSTTNNVSADAITSCLRTTNNTLSVWHIESEGDLDKAVLALVANQDRLDKIDVVFLEEKTLIDDNLEILATPGNTPVTSLEDSHRDISGLSYINLGNVKDHIVEGIRDNRLKRYTVNSLKKLINDAINNGLLAKEDLKESVINKIYPTDDRTLAS